MNDLVTDGVFFERPGLLPRGRHDLHLDQVRVAQRERLMIAVTEEMALRGYSAIVVKDLVSRARVSTAAFYQCFADKDDCVYAAYDRFIEVLLHRVAAAVDGPPDWEGTVSAVVSAYLDALSADPVVARAFQVEMDALGRPARERRRVALTGIADLLKQRRDAVWPGAEDVPLDAYVGAVYAVRQLASDHIDDQADEHAGAPAAALAQVGANALPWLARMLQSSTVRNTP